MRRFLRSSFFSLSLGLLLADVAAIAQSPPTTISPVADTYVKGGQANQNEGIGTFLRVQSSGSNRALLRFDQAAIQSALGTEGLASAVLRLHIETNGDNWGATGRPVNVHRMTTDWTELGATWNCPDDTDPANGSPDCSSQWPMGSGPWPFELAPTAISVHQNGQSGWVEWDVTADVQFYLDGAANYGWVVRKDEEGSSGLVEYSSREGATPPELIITPGDPPPPPPLMLTSISDAYLKSGTKNRNYGNETVLQVQSSGNNRVLVAFSQAAIENAVGSGTLVSAKLRLGIASNGNNWGAGGGEVNVHRMTAAWTEQGATWNCPDDTNPANSSPDCGIDWEMSNSPQWPFEATRSGFYLHTNGLNGTVEIDVTSDVAAYLSGSAGNYGWIVKKDNEGASGQAEYSSRESGSAPELMLEVQGAPTDTTPPTITSSVSPPANAAGWNNTSVTVTFDCQDAESGIVFCTDPASVGALGSTTVLGLAQDGAFNTAEESVAVQIDTLAPSVTPVLTPSPNAAGWNNSDVTVTFQAQDSISGIASATQPMVLTQEAAGQVVNGSATDLAGNTTDVTASVSLDKTAPQLAVESPQDGTTVLVSTLEISGTLTDSLSGIASLQCAAENAEIVSGAFTCVVSLAPDANAIDVVAVDVAGNSSTQTMNVTFAAPPTLTIDSPLNFSTFTAGPVTVSGTTSPDATQVLIGGIPATLSGGGFSAIVPLHTGTNTITAVALNAAGNSGMATIHVTLDDSAPFVSIDTVLDGEVVGQQLITVGGQIGDPVGPTDGSNNISVTVNGVVGVVGGGRYVVEGVALSPGLNTLTAQAFDSAGNMATFSITVNFHALTGSPSLQQVSGDLQQAIIGEELDDPLVVSATNAAGAPVAGVPVVFRVTRGSGALDGGGASARMVTVATNGQGQASASLTLGTRAGQGSNAVEATATGFQGKARFSAAGLPDLSFHLHHDDGDNQVGIVGQPLPFPLIVAATDSGHNRLPNVPITFTVQSGGGNFAGQPDVTVLTDPEGFARVTLTLGPTPGISDQVVVADTPGNTGSVISFSASAKVPGDPAETSVSGIVLDNTNIPVPGVTVSIDGTPLTAQTTAEGRFFLQPAPIGAFHLHVDGATATRPGAWASLEFEMVTIPGVDNDLGMPVHILPIDVPNSVHVSPTQGGTVTLAAIPGFALEVAPGSATFPGGGDEGDISVTLVHADKVPMTPNFGQQPRLIITVQPPGVILDPPAKVTYPNLDGELPGQTVELYSFDHDMERFVSTGTGTVSEDGLSVVSDPGVGITKTGWQCSGNPPPSGQCQPAQVFIDGPTVLLQGEAASLTAVGSPPGGTYTWTGGNQNISLGSAVGPSVSITAEEVGSADFTVTYLAAAQAPPANATRTVESRAIEISEIRNVQQMAGGELTDQVLNGTSAFFVATVTAEPSGTPYFVRWSFLGGVSDWIGPFVANQTDAYEFPVPPDAEHKINETLTADVAFAAGAGPEKTLTRDIRVLFDALTFDDTHNRNGSADSNWFIHYGDDQDAAVPGYRANSSTSFTPSPMQAAVNIDWRWKVAHPNGPAVLGEIQGSIAGPVVELYNSALTNNTKPFQFPLAPLIWTKSDGQSFAVVPSSSLTLGDDRQGIDLLTNVASHELEHWRDVLFWEAPNGPWFIMFGARTFDDGDGILESGENDWDNDFLPNIVEDESGVFDWSKASTYPLPIDDAEIRVRFTTADSPNGAADADWGFNGKQSTPPR